MAKRNWYALAVVAVLGLAGFFVGKAIAATVDPYAPTDSVTTTTTVTTSARPPLRDPFRPPTRSPFVP